MERTVITISGGFHNASPRRWWVWMDAQGTGRVTSSQAIEIRRHLCGVPDCACGGRGAQIDGAVRLLYEGIDY